MLIIIYFATFVLLYSKSISISFAVTCLAVLAGYRVGKTVSDDTGLEVLTLHNVEALAEGEDATWGGWNNFWQGQGFWKDEEKIREQCPKKLKLEAEVRGVMAPLLFLVEVTTIRKIPPIELIFGVPMETKIVAQ